MTRASDRQDPSPTAPNRGGASGLIQLTSQVVSRSVAASDHRAEPVVHRSQAEHYLSTSCKYSENKERQDAAAPALGWCRDRVASTNPHWGANGDSFFFVAASSRGPCCDGGQPRDPGLLRHHFIGHVGERSDGPWLFREARFADRLLRDSQYKAPVTRDTAAPRIRCFDERKDVSVPPPVFLLRDRGAGDIRGRSEGEVPSSDRDVLVLGAEGASGGLEYDLRQALTDFYDPGATDGSTTRRTRRLLETS